MDTLLLIPYRRKVAGNEGNRARVEAGQGKQRVTP